MNISKQLNLLIKLKQLTIKDFAEQCDIPYRSMYNYVRGDREPNLDALYKISQTFNVNLNWLITDQGEMFKNISNKNFSVDEYQIIEFYRTMPFEVKNAVQMAFSTIKKHMK